VLYCYTVFSIIINKMAVSAKVVYGFITIYITITITTATIYTALHQPYTIYIYIQHMQLAMHHYDDYYYYEYVSLSTCRWK
jgi:hypothetical protein